MKLVSIITPVYNAEEYLEETIQSVLNQTYENWELILVDDHSKDNSYKICEEYSKKDKRIKVYKQKTNLGVANTRNRGIDEARGEYICLLDADDIWDKEKLEKQVKFMEKQQCEFSFTGYEFINKKGQSKHKKVKVPKKIDYNQALKNTTIWTCTVMFDMNKLTKKDIYMPRIKSEDTACWWKVLKKVDYAYGLNEVLSFYRRRPNSLSSNKLKAIKRIWRLYRKQEKLSFFKSLYCFIHYSIRAVLRRI